MAPISANQFFGVGMYLKNCKGSNLLLTKDILNVNHFKDC